MQLAAEVNWLVDHVRWDAEEDLSRIIGDAPAHSAMQALRQAGADAQKICAKFAWPQHQHRLQHRHHRQLRHPAPHIQYKAKARSMGFFQRIWRGAFIVFIVLRYGLDELVLTSFQKPWLKLIARIVSVGRNLRAPRGQRLREALERLGPIFVKFGQVLSTRRDLMPTDIADELALLQDRVPPFDSKIAVATIERAFGRKVDDIFTHFDQVPVASASIAQVHFATVQDKAA